MKLGFVTLRFGIVVSRFNHIVTDKLLEGALEVLRQQGSGEEKVEIIKVPGCFEIPLAARQMIRTKRFDALICLGAVIRGETEHHKLVSEAVSQGIQKLSQEFEIPIGFGVVTAETMEQAINRAGGKAGNRGSEAALAAIEMVNVLRTLKNGTLKEDM